MIAANYAEPLGYNPGPTPSNLLIGKDTSARA
jgi:hypothetical protein